MFRNSKRPQKELELEDACRMLSDSVQSFNRTYICIDTLDECKDEYRRVFLQSLGQVSKASKNAVKLFLTGRPHVEGEVNRYLESPAMVRIAAHHHCDDMEVGENRVRVFYGTEKIEGERLEIYTEGISPCSRTVYQTCNIMYICNNHDIMEYSSD